MFWCDGRLLLPIGIQRLFGALGLRYIARFAFGVKLVVGLFRFLFQYLVDFLPAIHDSLDRVAEISKPHSLPLR